MNAELFFVPGRGDLHGGVERRALFLVPVGLARRRAALFFDGDAGPLGERANRLGERVALDLLEEPDRVAALLASEAVVETGVRVHVEARRLLLVKGTQAEEAATPLLQ